MSHLILVVDDETEIADLVAFYLQNEDFMVRKAATAAEALALTRDNVFDLALLDVMLPDMSGFDLCRAIRKDFAYPIIMLTARVEDMDKITGLTIGADDYITKPFNPLEMVARVKAQLRRVTQYNEAVKANAQIIDFGGLYLDRDTHECSLNEQKLNLTPIEFSILWLLCENRGSVISSERLFHEVWQEKYFSNSNNTVMVHIRHLREKMHEPPGNPRIIKTVWGVGYKIDAK